MERDSVCFDMMEMEMELVRLLAHFSIHTLSTSLQPMPAFTLLFN